MLNNVNLMGNLAVEPVYAEVGKDERKKTPFVRYRIAVKRNHKDESGEYSVDFISCKAFGHTAAYAHEYLHKGDLIVVNGSVVTEAYDDEGGQRRYFTGVLVKENYLARSRREDGFSPEKGGGQ